MFNEVLCIFTLLNNCHRLLKQFWVVFDCVDLKSIDHRSGNLQSEHLFSFNYIWFLKSSMNSLLNISLHPQHMFVTKFSVLFLSSSSPLIWILSWFFVSTFEFIFALSVTQIYFSTAWMPFSVFFSKALILYYSYFPDLFLYSD